MQWGRHGSSMAPVVGGLSRRRHVVVGRFGGRSGANGQHVVVRDLREHRRGRAVAAPRRDGAPQPNDGELTRGSRGRPADEGALRHELSFRLSVPRISRRCRCGLRLRRLGRRQAPASRRHRGATERLPGFGGGAHVGRLSLRAGRVRCACRGRVGSGNRGHRVRAERQLHLPIDDN